MNPLYVFEARSIGGYERMTGFRCAVCRKEVRADEKIMYAQGCGKEVVIHSGCADRRDVSPADVIEMLGLSAGYGMGYEIMSDT